MLDTVGQGRGDRLFRAPAAAWLAAPVAGRSRAWAAAAALAVFAVALGAPLVFVAAASDHLEYPIAAAVLRASWIGLYAVVGLYFARSPSHRRLGLTMTAVAAVTAVTAADVLAGAAAYTVSRSVVIALVPVLVLMLIAVPEAAGVRARMQRLLLLSIPVAVALGIAELMVTAEAPWGQGGSQCAGACAGSAIQVTDAPAAAHVIAWLVAILMVALLVATFVTVLRENRAASPLTGRTLRWIAWLLAVWGTPFAIGIVAVAVNPEPEALLPYLTATSVLRALLPVGLLAIVLGHTARTGSMRDELTTRLAGADEPAEVERVIADVLGDPSLRVAFRDGSEWINVDGRPIEAGAGDRGWVALNGERSAALVFDPGLRAQADRMRVIAGIGAAALERARTVAELRAVRRRLVSVAEEERHRIERNLHDGAQQRLISMSVRVAMARETLASHPEGANAILRAFGDDVQQVLDELRELARGLYPPVLVNHGIPEALRSLARHSPVPVDTTIAPVGRREPLTEAAVYFCCAEALQNAVKHGGPAPRISLRLQQDAEGAVVFEVRDDGRGFAVGPLRPGTGLMGMRDRVEAVEGTLTITSSPGDGTWVRGRIPPDRRARPAPAA